MTVDSLLPLVVQNGGFSRPEYPQVAECLQQVLQCMAAAPAADDPDDLADWLAEQLTADTPDDQALFVTRVCYAAADYLID